MMRSADFMNWTKDLSLGCNLYLVRIWVLVVVLLGGVGYHDDCTQDVLAECTWLGGAVYGQEVSTGAVEGLSDEEEFSERLADDKDSNEKDNGNEATVQSDLQDAAQDKSRTGYDFFNTYGLVLLPTSVRRTIRAEFFSDTYLSYQISSLLSDVMPQSVYLLEAAGSYSFANDEIYSLYGNSWLWNRAYINDIEVSSAYFSGRSLHKFIPVGYDITFDGIKGVRDYSLPVGSKKGFVYNNVTAGYIGEAVPYYETIANESIINFFPAQKRDIKPPKERPGTISSSEGSLRFVLPKKRTQVPSYANEGVDEVFSGAPFVIDVYYHLGGRNFLQFDYDGFDKVFREFNTAMTVSGHTDWTAKRLGGETAWTAGFVASAFSRTKLGAEFYFREEETLNFTSLALTGYAKQVLRVGGGVFSGSYAISTAWHTLADNNSNNAPFNVLRVTGEGLFPYDFNNAEAVVEITPQVTYAYVFDVYRENFLKLAGSTRLAVVTANPAQKNDRQAVYFQDRTNHFSLYESHIARDFTAYAILDEQFNLILNDHKQAWWKIEVGFDLDALLLRAESAARITPRFAITLESPPTRWVSLGFLLGRENIPFTTEYAKFLSADYKTTENYLWNDSNRNNRVDAGEVETGAGGLYSTEGGRYQRLSSKFNQPHYYYIDVPFSLHMTKNWALSLGIHYRLFKQSPWVCYEGNASDYGSYREVAGGEQVYFETNGEKRYEICNLPTSYFPTRGRNWFNNSPIYFGATAGFTGVGKRYVVSLSFTAHLINGITRQGNGPLHNNLGFFERTMADPNNLVRPVGRYDPDRAYLIRLFLSYAFLRNLIAATSIAYRDGQPIGSWDYHFANAGNGTQISWVRREVSGDNLLLYNGEFGTREDAFFTVDFRLKWIIPLKNSDLEFHFNIYNLFDFALETVEYAVYDEEASKRIALELEPPRTIEFIIKYVY